MYQKGRDNKALAKLTFSTPRPGLIHLVGNMHGCRFIYQILHQMYDPSNRIEHKVERLVCYFTAERNEDGKCLGGIRLHVGGFDKTAKATRGSTSAAYSTQGCMTYILIVFTAARQTAMLSDSSA